jgi:hypothetical protein
MKKQVIISVIIFLAATLFVQAAPVRKLGMLSDKQLEGLKSDWTSKDGKKAIKFVGSISQTRLDPKKDKIKLDKFKKNGKVPFRVTCSLYEGSEKSGKMVSKRSNIGSATFYLVDAKGNLAGMKSSSLSKMCPS